MSLHFGSVTLPEVAGGGDPCSLSALVIILLCGQTQRHTESDVDERFTLVGVSIYNQIEIKD